MESKDYNPVSGNMPDDFDRQIADLLQSGQQRVSHSAPRQVRVVGMFGVGSTSNFSFQTFRQAGEILEEDGDTVKRGPTRFTVAIEIAKGEKLSRHILPHEVVEGIIRQREALTVQAQRKAGREKATRRMAAGWKPFAGKRGRKK